MKSVVDVIIPAFNEAAAIGKVIAALPNSVREIVVADNGSTDGTSGVAQQHGATVVTETQKGYGHACLKAMAYIEKKTTPPDIVVFLDGDFSDYPEELPKLVAPIASKEAVFVVGVRSAALRTKNALTPQQQFGNALATLLMRWLYNSRFTDLGPFRAIDWKTLLALNMKDKNLRLDCRNATKNLTTQVALRRNSSTLQSANRYLQSVGNSQRHYLSRN